MTILFYIMFAMIAALMFAAGALIAYIEGKKELISKYQGVKYNDIKRKI